MAEETRRPEESFKKAIPMIDPKRDLRRLTETRKLPISSDAINKASEIEAISAVLLMDHIRSTEDKFESLRKGQNETHDTLSQQDKVLDEIRITTANTNGKVKVLRADTDVLQIQVKALMDKDGQRTAQALNEELEKRTKKAVTDGVLIIPKPSWKQLVFAGGLLTFIGFDRLLTVLKTIWHMLPH